MAKNNKYTSINFNHIYEKSTSTTSSNTNLAKTLAPSPSPSYSATSYSAISAPNKAHGRMLVLARPTPTPKPKPVQPQPRQQQQQQQQPPKQTQQVADQPRSDSSSDAISLRPLGRTGTGSSLSSPVLNYDRDKEMPPALPVVSPKPDKFVPPHLRPGFVPKEEKPGPELGRGHRQQGHAGSPGRYVENGRPKSGGYERMRRVGVSDMGMMNRPRSSGSRPSSSGWYVRNFVLLILLCIVDVWSVVYDLLLLRFLCFVLFLEFWYDVLVLGSINGNMQNIFRKIDSYFVNYAR